MGWSPLIGSGDVMSGMQIPVGGKTWPIFVYTLHVILQSNGSKRPPLLQPLHISYTSFLVPTLGALNLPLVAVTSHPWHFTPFAALCSLSCLDAVFSFTLSSLFPFHPLIEGRLLSISKFLKNVRKTVPK